MERVYKGDITAECCSVCGKAFAALEDAVMGESWMELNGQPVRTFIFHEGCWYGDFVDGSSPDWEECGYYQLIDEEEWNRRRSQVDLGCITEHRVVAYQRGGDGPADPITAIRDAYGVIGYGFGEGGGMHIKVIDMSSLDEFEQGLVSSLGWDK